MCRMRPNSESEEFWMLYTQCAYQWGFLGDGDPNEEKVKKGEEYKRKTYGITFFSGNTSFVFLLDFGQIRDGS